MIDPYGAGGTVIADFNKKIGYYVLPDGKRVKFYIYKLPLRLRAVYGNYVFEKEITEKEVDDAVKGFVSFIEFVGGVYFVPFVHNGYLFTKDPPVMKVSKADNHYVLFVWLGPIRLYSMYLWKVKRFSS